MDPIDSYAALMSPDEVAKHMGVSVYTLKGWRRERKGPEYVKLGEGPNATVRYPRESLRRFLADNTITPAVTP